MIVIRSPKDGRVRTDGRLYLQSMPQVRPDHHVVGSRVVIGSTATQIEGVAQLSREYMEAARCQTGRFRNESEDMRDDVLGGIIAYPRRGSIYIPATRSDTAGSTSTGQYINDWSSRNAASISQEWQRNASESRPHRSISSSWSYHRPTSSHALGVPRSLGWDWVRNRRSQSMGRDGYYNSRGEWSSWPPSSSAQSSGQNTTSGSNGINSDNPPRLRNEPPVKGSSNHLLHVSSSKRKVESPPTLPPLTHPVVSKKSKGMEMLDLLCQATLNVGPMQENPAGCSCPKSKCIALYCDCFKAGRRCDPQSCGCVDCKNTLEESGVDGARSKAIRSILARNPRAFLNAGLGASTKKLAPGEFACNCVRSRCLKLYCTCFQNGKACKPDICTCVGCSNLEDGCSERQLAIQMCLEKRPDAFKVRVREPGLGCACKNNRCIRKYCECFRTNLACTEKCSCRQCANQGAIVNEEV